MLGSDLRRYTAGEEVLAVYRSNDHPDGCRYVKVADREETFPVVGLSVGWLIATVLEDFHPESLDERSTKTYVHLEFGGTFQDPHSGFSENLRMLVHPSRVRRFQSDKPDLHLALFCVRWWDYWSNTDWSDCDITSDAMLRDLIDGPYGVDQELPCEYELYTAFVKSSDDFSRINGDAVRSMLRAPNISAWYFLRPTRYEDDGISKPGCVPEHKFFALCQKLERAGIPSGWPQTSYLYRLLCGKFWVPQMCLHRDYKVPATSRVHYAEFADAAQDSAQRAIGCLRDLRSHAGFLPNVSAEDLKGVAKLGFTCIEEEVMPFCGVESLSRVLQHLFSKSGSEQTVCIVQEMVPDVVCEQRLLCFQDALNDTTVRERLWVQMMDKGKNEQHHQKCNELSDFAFASTMVVSEDVALKEIFDGNHSALKQAQEQADALVEHWLTWFCVECPEPPSVTRLDFLVSYSKESKQVSVWTCKVGDCGSSLCGVPVDARNAAALNSAMRNDESERFPRPLPSIRAK